ncbi:MAG: outer membrane beta-barrel protein [Alphaproteobacteria bacterium]|nr:outer membrane beta-barrel protein [Alphaproteobacteria bacterium]
MKKTIVSLFLCMAITPAAQAQDKYANTYNSQQSSPTRSQAAPSQTGTYGSTSSTTMYDDSSSSPLTGAYLGAYGGYGWTDADTTAGNLEVDGADYGVFLGYKLDEYLQDKIGITGAVEAHLGWSGADDSIAGTSVEKEHEWGVDFRPGISISKMLNPYAIIGYRRASFDSPTLGDQDFDGFDLGIGTELVTWDRVGMRLDYVHTWYGEENGIDPDENDIRLGLSYHW